KVTRTMRGLMRSTRRTVTWRKRGGSRRTRTGRASATGDGRQHRHLGALGHDRVDVVEVARVLGAYEHVDVTAQGAGFVAHAPARGPTQSPAGSRASAARPSRSTVSHAFSWGRPCSSASHDAPASVVRYTRSRPSGVQRNSSDVSGSTYAVPGWFGSATTGK